MLSSNWRLHHSSLACLLLLACLAAGVLTGCGGGEDSTTRDVPLAFADDFKPEDIAALNWVKRKYGDEAWFPHIKGIYIAIGVPTKSATVQTTLYGHGEKKARRNKRMAEEICRAVIASPQVEMAGVFYDDVRGGSTAQCS